MMPEESSASGADRSPATPPALRSALERWRLAGRSAELIAWLDGELDAEGLPRRLPTTAWGECLDSVAAVVAGRPGGWPETCDARLEGWVRSTFRFLRPDGSAIFAAPGPDPGRLAGLRAWAERLSDPTLVALAHRWCPPRGGRDATPGPPPLPAHASPVLPMAILRPDWSARGDWIAVDQRQPAGPTLLELVGAGRRWLGPAWSAGADPGDGGSAGPARPTHWQTGPFADLAEWAFDTPGGRVVRMALLLRGRSLALLADQVDGADPHPAMRMALAAGVGAGVGVGSAPAAEAAGLALAAGRGRSLRLLPIGLPMVQAPNDRGSLAIADGSIVLRQRAEGGRCWLPLLASWLPGRDRRPTRWRPLTVAEGSRACPPGVAFAARVTWGRGETLVIYKSLAKPALRTFLGHQTRARFLVGLFTRDGDVRPLAKIEE